MLTPGMRRLERVSFLTRESCSAKKRAYLETLHTQNVRPEVYTKGASFAPLTVDEIEHLVAQGIPEDQILYHLKKSRAIYQLRPEDVDRLRKVGTSEKLISYLVNSPAKVRPYYPPPYYYGPYHGWGYPYPYYRPYYCPPYYYPYGGGIRYRRFP